MIIVRVKSIHLSMVHIRERLHSTEREIDETLLNNVVLFFSTFIFLILCKSIRNVERIARNTCAMRSAVT